MSRKKCIYVPEGNALETIETVLLKNPSICSSLFVLAAEEFIKAHHLESLNAEELKEFFEVYKKISEHPNLKNCIASITATVPTAEIVKEYSQPSHKKVTVAEDLPKKEKEPESKIIEIADEDNDVSDADREQMQQVLALFGNI